MLLDLKQKTYSYWQYQVRNDLQRYLPIRGYFARSTSVDLCIPCPMTCAVRNILVLLHLLQTKKICCLLTCLTPSSLRLRWHHCAVFIRNLPFICACRMICGLKHRCLLLLLFHTLLLPRYALGWLSATSLMLLACQLPRVLYRLRQGRHLWRHAAAPVCCRPLVALASTAVW